MILRAFRDLYRLVYFVCREGQSKMMWDESQGISVRCRVQSGESLKSNFLCMGR